MLHTRLVLLAHSGSLGGREPGGQQPRGSLHLEVYLRSLQQMLGAVCVKLGVGAQEARVATRSASLGCV